MNRPHPPDELLQPGFRIEPSTELGDWEPFAVDPDEPHSVVCKRQVWTEEDEPKSSTRVEIPVEEAQIVANGVGPKVGEFGAAAFALAEAVAFHAAGADFLAHQLQRLQSP